ncbi:solute carrier family 25 (mitochondrial folate transporter), member 32 [Cryptococcus neoformans]|nr:solute carrier family 25 (mitochondrial folate transporter), member 32 [Cryptococcus neoformans var. grubii Bt1]OXG33190.1 solute carrier family 25 (mitochondrial folate transporter), member 32 [Cryptococcus neoformans var. grubii Ze90-1]OXH41269.1 solute carrier family 25 (mitochondrial folate transporter), member 32 [Cryptococcus neoformans var. grubii]
MSGNGSSSFAAPPSARTLFIPPQFHSMTAGAGAGLVSSIVTCPLDVVKTRLQAQAASVNHKDYQTVEMIIKDIWTSGGFRGFYRGLGPTLAGYLPTWGIYFTVYDMVKDRLGAWAAHSDLPTNPSMVHIVAAMTAGATGTCMTSPLWVIKTRLMAQVGPSDQARYRNTLEAIVDIYRNEGFRAFYKGLLPSLMGISHVAVQFPLYEKAKSWADHNTEGDHSTLTPSTILICSAFSKMVASIATYPHEVLRTRLQIRKSSPKSNSSSSNPSKPSHPPLSLSSMPPNYLPSANGKPHPPLDASSSTASHAHTPSDHQTRPLWRSLIKRRKEGGIIDTFLSIRNQDGWRGFYRGLSINLIRTVPSSAVTMLTYELIMRRLSSSTS